MDLKEGTVYLIRNIYDNKYRHFEGTFSEYISLPYRGGRQLAPKFINCNCYNRIHFGKVDKYSDSSYSRGNERRYLNSNSVFADPIHTRYYDAEKVKNAQHAKQNRERRTVNMIIRQLIGDETFEW